MTIGANICSFAQMLTGPSQKLRRVWKITKKQAYNAAMAFPKREFEPLNIQLLVDSIPAMIHTGRPDGYLDYFNKPWLEYLGATLEQVSGWNWTAFIHPEDLDGIVAKWRGCLATGEVFEYETRVRRANGEYRWMFHHKVPLRDANGNIVKWYGSSLDIEERKRAEEKIRQSEQELRTITETIPAFIGTNLPDGSIDFVGQSFLDYLGLSREQWLDWGWMTATHPDDVAGAVEKFKAALAAGQPLDYEQRLRKSDGTYRWFWSRNVPLPEKLSNGMASSPISKIARWQKERSGNKKQSSDR
jgi:PAS domain S-box-containing protein